MHHVSSLAPAHKRTETHIVRLGRIDEAVERSRSPIPSSASPSSLGSQHEPTHLSCKRVSDKKVFKSLSSKYLATTKSLSTHPASSSSFLGRGRRYSKLTESIAARIEALRKVVSEVLGGGEERRTP